MVQHSDIDHAGATGVISGLVIIDESTTAGTATVLKIVGGAATVAVSGGTATYTDLGVVVQDDGSAVGTAVILNFTNGTATYAGGTATINLAAGGGAVATDGIWAAKGDLAAGTADNAAAVLTVGANGSILEAASGAATGLKYSRTLRGKIQGSDGAILQGAGFTAARNNTGDYTITITSAFAAAPIVVGSCITTSSSRWFTADTISTTSIHVYTSSNVGLADVDFSFIAIAET
jgi:hypothetical protein